jgi:hypothetical protein
MTMQPTSSVIPSLGVSTSISNRFVASHIIFPTHLLLASIPLTFPSYMYTPQPYSSPSQNTRNDPLINHLMQTIMPLQKQVSTMNQNSYGFPIYYVKGNTLSLDILRMTIPQGIGILRLEKCNGKGDPTSHVNALIYLCSQFFLHERLLAKKISRTLREASLEWFSSFLNHFIHSFQELVKTFINHFQLHMTPKLILARLMRCKQHEHENVTNFISRYQ